MRALLCCRCASFDGLHVELLTSKIDFGIGCDSFEMKNGKKIREKRNWHKGTDILPYLNKTSWALNSGNYSLFRYGNLDFNHSKPYIINISIMTNIFLSRLITFPVYNVFNKSFI